MSSFSTVITKHYATTLGSSKLLFRFKQMSSQSATGPSDYGSVTRDASDITRQQKERLIYREKHGDLGNLDGKSSLITSRALISPGGENHIPAGNAEMLWIPQGNQFRLSYLFGKINCGSCSGGAFNLNGPIFKS